MNESFNFHSCCTGIRYISYGYTVEELSQNSFDRVGPGSGVVKCGLLIGYHWLKISHGLFRTESIFLLYMLAQSEIVSYWPFHSFRSNARG
ncbi:MAG: hypothetical protein KTR32_33035 [Granulosicoccus sp.]|nr:hypothetical protein [Granulosicoccus sp.]